MQRLRCENQEECWRGEKKGLRGAEAKRGSKVEWWIGERCREGERWSGGEVKRGWTVERWRELERKREER